MSRLVNQDSSRILPQQVPSAPGREMEEQATTRDREPVKTIWNNIVEYIPECEVFYEGGPDQKTLVEGCTANPDHTNFISIKDFTMEHLPKDLQNEVVMKVIEDSVRRTVKIFVPFTSPGRPDTYPNTNYNYPYRGLKGSTRDVRAGTGFLFSVYTGTIKNKPCPCHECQKCPKNAKTTYYILYISTAAHVVYDKSEAERAVCQLFYDSEDMSKVKYLYGVRLVDDDNELNEYSRESRIFKAKEMFKCYDDRVRLECVTHDGDIIDKLLNNVSFISYVKASEFLFPYAVTVSHPHGGCKKISVGTILKRTVEFRNGPNRTFQLGSITKFCKRVSLKDKAIDEFEHSALSNSSGVEGSTLPLSRNWSPIVNIIYDECSSNVENKAVVDDCFDMHLQESGCEFVFRGITSLEISLPPDANFFCELKFRYSPWVSFPFGTTFTFRTHSPSGEDLVFMVVDDIELYIDDEAIQKKVSKYRTSYTMKFSDDEYKHGAPPTQMPTPEKSAFDSLVDLLCNWDTEIPPFPSDFRHWPFHMCYDTPTCPGCSGAPVLFFEDGSYWINHSGSITCNGIKLSSTPHYD